jgi:hypothetical protein
MFIPLCSRHSLTYFFQRFQSFLVGFACWGQDVDLCLCWKHVPDQASYVNTFPGPLVRSEM